MNTTIGRIRIAVLSAVGASMLALAAGGCATNLEGDATEPGDDDGAEVSLGTDEERAAPSVALHLREIADFVPDARVGLGDTAVVIKSAAAFRAYFRAAPPADVNFAREWLIFYSAGRDQAPGTRARVAQVTASSRTLSVTTRLERPGENCEADDGARVRPTTLVAVTLPADASCLCTARRYREEGRYACEPTSRLLFEESWEGDAARWTTATSEPVAIVTDNPACSTRFQRETVPTGYGRVFSTATVSATAGRAYCLGAWVRGTPGAQPYLGVRVARAGMQPAAHWLIGGAGTETGYPNQRTVPVVSDGAWRWVTAGFRAEAAATGITVMNELFADGAAGAADFDDIQLYAGVCPAQPPHPERAACRPARIDDPFDARSCDEAPLTQAEIAARLGSARAVTLGRVRVSSRARECSSEPCTAAWTSTAQFEFSRGPSRPPLPYQWASPLAATAALGYSEIRPTTFALQLTSDDALPTDSPANFDAMRVECFDGLGTQQTTCRSWAELRRNGVIGPDMAPTISVGASQGQFIGRLSRTCLRLVGSGRTALTATSWREVQVGVLGRFGE